MANVYAVKSGNWSDVTVWNTGTLPASDDTVRPNGFTVTIDQDITVELLVNDALSPAIAGGFFNIESGGFTVTADIEGRAGLFNTGVFSVSNNCTVIGNISGNQVSGNSNHYGSVVQKDVTLTLIGNVKGGLGNSAYGLSLNGLNCIVNMTGTIEGGDNNSSGGGLRLGGSNCKLNLDGVSIGGLAQVGITTAVNNCILEGNVTAAPGSVTNTRGVTNTALSPNVRVKNLILGGMDNNVRFAAFQPTFTHIGSTGDTLILTDQSTTDMPIPANVREGITYNSSASTGTLKVPNSGSVALGVPFDNNSFGTAVLTAEAIWNTQQDTMTVSGSIGERLKNVATVQTTAAQIASF